MHGHSVSSCWSKYWTQQQVHRFLIKWKIGRFLFSYPSRVSTDEVPGNVQMETIHVQRDGGLKKRTIAVGNLIYISNILTRTHCQQYTDTNTLPATYWHEHTASNSLTRPTMVFLFGITHLWEQIFFLMKNVKSVTRARRADALLENSLHIAGG
jgi:hypothetical protein